MKIYTYIPDSDEFNSFLFKVEDREKRSILVSGETCSETWKPVNIEEYKAGKVGHFPSLYRSVPVFSKKVIDVFTKEFGLNMEVLPIVNQPDFFIVNILEVIDALNHQESIISRNDVTGRVSSIQKYVFMEEKLHNKHLFKIPETLGLEVYVSDTFKKVVEDNGLEGLSFEKLVYAS